MRIAIVGGRGTLGSYVTAELARRGHDVRVLSRSGEYRVDLTTGEGLAAALEGCAAVVDASNATRGAAHVLVEGSRRLLAAGNAAGVTHHVCVSIVGCNRVPFGYYRVKTDQERVVEQGPVPWSIVQATQFHELAAAAFGAAGKFRVLPAPRFPLQTVAAAEVAVAVADVTEGQPRHGRLQVAGPEVRTAAELARTWRRVTGRPALLLPVPLPGKTGRELRQGALTATDPDVRGTIVFADWLAAREQG
ncbi:MAG TPA: NAD(P)H-binding protein [Streptosporangiaceae bacterium]|nr:NAD(P)H-binding protein [Streptosporangiaceae bacterium]